MSPHARLALRSRQLKELEDNANEGCPSALKALPAVRAEVESLTAKVGALGVEADKPATDARDAKLAAANDRIAKLEADAASKAKAGAKKKR